MIGAARLRGLDDGSSGATAALVLVGRTRLRHGSSRPRRARDQTDDSNWTAALAESPGAVRRGRSSGAGRRRSLGYERRIRRRVVFVGAVWSFAAVMSADPRGCVGSCQCGYRRELVGGRHDGGVTKSVDQNLSDVRFGSVGARLQLELPQRIESGALSVCAALGPTVHKFVRWSLGVEHGHDGVVEVVIVGAIHRSICSRHRAWCGSSRGGAVVSCRCPGLGVRWQSFLPVGSPGCRRPSYSGRHPSCLAVERWVRSDVSPLRRRPTTVVCHEQRGRGGARLCVSVISALATGGRGRGPPHGGRGRSRPSGVVVTDDM